MHETFSTEKPLAVDAVHARRNPGRLSPKHVNKAAFGPFCDAVRRLRCLTPTQRLLAWLLAQATLRQGFTSLAYSSQTELTQVRPHGKPFAGLGKNDLSPALNALGEFGLVKLEERGQLESGVPPVTLLLVIADATQWAVPADGWLYSEGEEQEVLVHLLACRRRWTAQLPELAEEADLDDARAAGAVEAVAGNGRDIHLPTTNGAAARCHGPTALAVDARGVHRERTRGANGPCGSDFRNSQTPEKARCVPTSGTPTRARLLNREQRTETVQQLNGARQTDDSNRLLALLVVEFERVHGSEWTRKEMINSGAAWRMVARRWPEEFEVQVGEMRNYINGGGKVKCAWAYFQSYFKRAVGCDTWLDVCEKSKESFKSH